MGYLDAIKTLSTHSEVGQIQAYLRAQREGAGEDTALSPALRAKLDRVEFCKKQITVLIATGQIIQAVQEQFGVSQATAYQDLHDCRSVYGERQIWQEHLLLQIAETRKIALKRLDVRGLNTSDKNLADAIVKFFGDKNAIDFDSFVPPVLIWAEVPEPAQPIEELEKEMMLYFEKKHRNAVDTTYEILTDEPEPIVPEPSEKNPKEAQAPNIGIL